jgi:hypothetical protein
MKFTDVLRQIAKIAALVGAALTAILAGLESAKGD